MTDLILPLKGIYWHQIKAGEKLEEYRLCTPYWHKRLAHRTYDRVVLTLGYTPEQLSQAMRDALEQAATYADKMGMITAPEIRAMIKEIPE